MTNATVFFSDVKGPRGVVRWLKPGFRHCFAVLPDPWGGWNVLEACQHQTFVEHNDLPDLLALLADVPGWVSVEARIRRAPSRAPLLFRPYTCVEAVKAVLGIRAAGVFTPWQLYTHLRRKDH